MVHGTATVENSLPFLKMLNIENYQMTQQLHS